MELGVHAGEWSALLCGSPPPPQNGAAPLGKGINSTYTRHKFKTHNTTCQQTLDAEA
jgi:hypothetical protein